MSEFNLKSTTVEKGLDLAKDFLGKLVSQTVEELGLLMSDNIKHIRLKNQIRNLEKVRAIVEGKKMTLKQVNLKVLFPYLEGIAVEEDETLQEMWANLFVNYIDSKSNLKLTVYPQILKQLSTVEVEILKESSNVNSEKFKISAKHIKFDYNVNNFELNNLERLGLMEQKKLITSFGTYQRRVHSELESTDLYFITEFGTDFIEACTLKGTKE